MKILHLVCSCMAKIKANYVHRKELAKPTQEDELKVCFGAVRRKLDFSKRKTAKILLLNVKLSSVLAMVAVKFNFHTVNQAVRKLLHNT